jgi:hypothetical protein
VTMAPNGCHKSGGAPHCETPLGFVLTLRWYPGCAARPWAMLCDTYGVEISPHLFVTPHLLIAQNANASQLASLAT